MDAATAAGAPHGPAPGRTAPRTLVDTLRAAVAAGRAPDAAARLALLRTDDTALLRTAGRALAAVADPDGELRPLRVAVAASGTVGPYEALLRARLVGCGALPHITLAPDAELDRTLATGGFAPDADVLACVLDASFFLPAERDLDLSAPEEVAAYADARLAHLRDLITVAAAGTAATLVLNTVPLPGHVADTVLSLRARTALTLAWYRLNTGLLELAADSNRIHVTDLVGRLGDTAVAARDERLHAYAGLPYTDGALLLLADGVRRTGQARLGLSRKVLALDLDNTLWGGVLGEVGAEGVALGGLYPGKSYQRLQRTARALRDQGVILVLTSKNDPDPVRRALSEHPEVLLRPEAFSATAVNWDSKAGNLAAAADTLGLATSAMVFMDDSPFERGEVAARLPDVAVIDAGGDPAHLVTSLVGGGWFDVVELTATDRERPELYRARGLRQDFSGGFATAEEYLAALDLTVTIEPVTAFTVARAAQLAARTNQFNLTGIRPDQAATAAALGDPGRLTAVVCVRDRFGDEGVVGALWVERGTRTWHVENFVLSCRVLGRGVEFAVAGWLAGQAARAGATRLTGAFVPSPKNGAAAGFWEKAGFAANGDGLFTHRPGQSADPTPAWITVTAPADTSEEHV